MSPDIPFPNYLEQKRQLTQWKKTDPFLKDVYSQTAQDVVKRMHNTWEAFKQRGSGFPRYKKFGQYHSFYYPQFKDNPITAESGGINRDGGIPSPRRLFKRGCQIKLPMIGLVPINQHRPVPDGFKVKGVRVVSRARNTQWYVVVTIQCDVSIPDTQPFGRAIGIDIGLENFLTTSDNFTVVPCRFFRDLQSRLKVLQRRVSRKQKRSKNWEKSQIKVARLHHQIANTRKNFHLHIAHQLCDQADSIFVEDIDFRVSSKGFLGKQMLDGAFGQFRALLQWVCWKRGKYFGQVDHRFTSQICPNCNSHTGKKDLSVREHQCSECGYQTTRDHAAAEVIKQRGESSIVPLDGRERKQPTECVLAGSNKTSQVQRRNALL